MLDVVRRLLTRLGVLAGHPLAFLLVFAYAAAWIVILIRLQRGRLEVVPS